jgi:hypothetical protein
LRWPSPQPSAASRPSTTSKRCVAFSDALLFCSALSLHTRRHV